MRDELHPFESIESAYEFMVLLESVIAETNEELQEILRDSGSERHANGVRLALFKIGQLTSHVGASRRILNDLTLIRGVLTPQAASVGVSLKQKS